jgi:PAS domain S-box-containing protein
MKKDGEILDLNHAGFALLKYPSEKLGAINLFHLFQNKNELVDFKNQLNKFDLVINMHVKLKDKNGKVFECMISVNKIEDKGKKAAEYQGIIKDMTKEKEAENLVIRTIVDTQEKERERFAKDLHDGLGIPLSGLRSYIDSLTSKTSDEKMLETIAKSKNAINYVVNELRNICFNIMPRTMKQFGLIGAISELHEKIESMWNLKFKISASKDFSISNIPLEIALFRIVQEFVNNAIKHGKAKNIIIKMQQDRKKTIITLKHDGVGFEYNKSREFDGMGLQNVRSRVSSYDGEVEIKSAVNKGTTYQITLPVKTNTE